MRNPELFQKNMALISQLYPHYPSLIHSVPDTETFAIEAAGERTYLCWDHSAGLMENRRWIHGPENPWDHAGKTIQGADWQTAETFLLLRPGLGYFPLTLYLNLRKGRNPQRMLLVEDRIELFRESLYLLDWTDVLRSDRTILLLQENPLQTALHFFQTNPVALLPVISVMCGVQQGADEKRIMQELQQQLTPLAQTVKNASNTYWQELERHYQAIQTDAQHKPKVVLVEPEHDYLARSVADGFRQNGCEVEAFEGNLRLLRFLNPYLWLVYTREHCPDLLLWMNRCSLSPQGVRHLRHLPIRKALWFLDNPKRVETGREEMEAVDLYFSFDATYLPYLKELSGKEGYYLPTAAGIAPLPENEPEKPRQPRQGADVGFTGSLAASRFQSVRRFWLERDPAFITLLDGIVEDYLADRSRSLEERYDQSPDKDRLPYQGFVVLYLEERATYLHRLRSLLGVKDLGLKTYGAPEWGTREWADDLAPCYTGTAPKYQEELPEVYYHTKINLNVFHVQCVNSTNPRVYDVLAAGGFLLTEYRPAIAAEFEEGKHLVWYQDVDELREKTLYYLKHEQEREAIALEGQRFVLKHTTYQARMKTILDAFAFKTT